MKQHILILNGPNLNLLGKREPSVYGNHNFESYFLQLKEKYAQQTELHYEQTNHEGKIIDLLQQYGFDYQGIVLNAAAYTHTSIAIADAIKSIPCPVIEVHISNVFAREKFRHHSYLAAVCKGTIVGLGLHGYQLAIEHFLITK
ncbi:MAG: type II 3-dehydroquinate dehydratase [Saprospiraceae bacterium]|nr:type II 3-dehydroquinate dehydratase [Saprospiraceae bacterium]